jgi:hypothetical protein
MPPTTFLGREALACPKCTGAMTDVARLLPVIREASDGQARDEALRLLSETEDPLVLDAVITQLWGQRRLRPETMPALSGCLLGFAIPFLAAGVFVLAASVERYSWAAGGVAAAILGVGALLLGARPLLWRRGKREEDAMADATRTILANWTHPQAVGALALAADHSELIQLAEDKLQRLLPRVTEAEAIRLTQLDLNALVRLLGRGSSPGRKVVSWRVLAEVVRVLGMTSHRPAISVLERLASESTLRDVPDVVRAVASEAAASIRARLASAAENKQLLRASSSIEADPSALLRAAGPGEEPTEQLLRPLE